MSEKTAAIKKDKPIYCRMLGHDVSFSYCEKPGSDIFCRNIAACWAARFDIETWLAQNYSAEEIAAAMQPKAPKMESLLSLIQKAKENTSS